MRSCGVSDALSRAFCDTTWSPEANFQCWTMGRKFFFDMSQKMSEVRVLGDLDQPVHSSLRNGRVSCTTCDHPRSAASGVTERKQKLERRLR